MSDSGTGYAAVVRVLQDVRYAVLSRLNSQMNFAITAQGKTVKRIICTTDSVVTPRTCQRGCKYVWNVFEAGNGVRGQ